MHKIVQAGLPALFLGCLLSAAVFGTVHARESMEFRCEPTPADMLGPFYKPGAPVRDTVGEGYLLTGTVRSAPDCSALPEARIEFWQAGSDGEYADEYRATLFSDEEGNYRFETVLPAPYAFRPPHIHLMVHGPGHEPLITQHYPEPGTDRAEFDLVLIPSR